MKDAPLHLENGSLIVSDLSGKIVYGSETLSERTGFRHPEIIGNSPGKLWGGSMPPAYYRTLWETIQSGHIFSGLFRNRKKNGTAYSESMAIAPLFDDSGKPQYFLAAQPFHLDEKKQNVFYNEFQSVFQEGEQERRSLVEWLARWFGGKSTGGAKGLSGIEENLIFPTQAIYHYRREDRELIQGAQSDPMRFSPLYEKYFGQVYSYFLARLGHDTELASDLTQDVFTRAFEKLPSFHLENASFGTYLFRVAHNLLVDTYRKASHLPAPTLASEKETLPSPAITPPFDFSALSLMDQKIMDLKYIQGFSVREIASKQNLSENAVKLRMSRARKKLAHFFGKK